MAYGINDFIIAVVTGYVIKEYFASYYLHMSDVTFDMRFNQMSIHCGYAEPWRVTLIDTGESTMTGGRLKEVREHVGNETFCFTYGDGVSNVNIKELIDFHKQQTATLTATQPGRFGAICLGQEQTLIPASKKEAWRWCLDQWWLFVRAGVIDYIADDSTVWEQEPLEKLAHIEQLSAYKHDGFGSHGYFTR